MQRICNSREYSSGLVTPWFNSWLWSQNKNAKLPAAREEQNWYSYLFLLSNPDFIFCLNFLTYILYIYNFSGMYGDLSWLCCKFRMQKGQAINKFHFLGCMCTQWRSTPVTGHQLLDASYYGMRHISLTLHPIFLMPRLPIQFITA